jgi:hypothetical protein
MRPDTPTPFNMDDGLADLCSILSPSSVKDGSQLKETHTPSPARVNSSLTFAGVCRSHCLSSTKDETQPKVIGCPDTQDISSSKNNRDVEIAEFPVAEPPQIDDMEKSQNDDNARVYTLRLIPRIFAGPSEMDEHFDEQEWYKRVYGPDIIVVSTTGVPDGWILVDGISLFLESS